MRLEVTKEQRVKAVMRYCTRCDRYTAQVPYPGRKYKWQCVRCGKKLTEELYVSER